MQRLHRDGVDLAYVDEGSGDPPLLFVHGWTCNHTYFQPQCEHFAPRQRVVAVDLRGHGESDKPEQEYTLEGFADDLAWLCERLDLRRPIVVGHSMGGAVVLVLAQRHPHVPGAIVMVDSVAVMQENAAEITRPLVEALYSPVYREAQQSMIESMLFEPTDEPAVRERIVREMTASPQYVTASSFKNLVAHDLADAARACRVPVLNVVGARPLQDVARTRALIPHLVHGQVVGAGHFLQLLVPEQLNAMIERFLHLYVPLS